MICGLLITINLNMSQERIFCSLPKKTQPTLASSNRPPRTTPGKTVLTAEGCPEVSEFKVGKGLQELYVHRLEIDYGRLQRPNYFYFDGPKYQKVVKMTDLHAQDALLTEEMNTKRVTGISLLAAEAQLHERDTEKKARKFEYLQERTEESRPASNPKKVKIKLTEVKAYEGLTKREPTVKRLHSRIVKMAVGGGKLTTKVITYPDNGEYLKLCGLG